MPNSTEEIEDALIRHQVYIMRVEGAQANDMVETIDSSTPELAGTIGLWLQGSRKGQQLTIMQDKSYDALTTKVSKIRGKAIGESEIGYRVQSRELIDHEIEYADGLFRDNIPVVTTYNIPESDKLASRLLNTASYQGATVSQWFSTMTANDTKRIISAIRFGVTTGLTNQEIVDSVIGTRSAGFTDGVVNTTRNDAKRLVRTVTNGLANDSRSAFYAQNADILLGERYTAVLDGRTSAICISLDGTVYKIGEPGPRPPMHPNCRSTMVPLIDDARLADGLGERPFVRDTRTRRKREIDFRKEARDKVGSAWSSMTTQQRRNAIKRQRRKWTKEAVGQVPAATTYEQWLRKQPKTFQNEVLGTARAKLWRSGKITAGDFIDRSGKVLTVEELRKLEN